MTTEISVPDIGDFENVVIIEILIEPGDAINKNDTVATLESDKSSVEIPSPFSGKISSLKVKIGDKVSKGSVLALIDELEQKSDEKKEEKKIEQRNKENKDSLKEPKTELLPETENIIKYAESTVVKNFKKEQPKKTKQKPKIKFIAKRKPI